MPSEKKSSEGIALLSMYGYEDDDDDEMEDVDEEDIIPLSNYLNDSSSPSKKPKHGNYSSASATPQQSLFCSELTYVESKKSRLLIVDYGHEEGDLSPDDGEMVATGRVKTKKLQPSTPPRSLEPDTVNVSDHQKAVDDPLNMFLPPPPKAKCSEDLQVRIAKFIGLKTTGRSFNSEVRKKKEYRNPDFLLHAVTYQAIDQIGSCFPKDVFDPHVYAESDFYDELEADMERREQERIKRTQNVDFTSAPKINLPTPGLMPAVGGGVINVKPAAFDVTARDGRQNKKYSKWDVEQDSLAAVGASHAALISAAAAKAGIGYSAFAQQRRKEAEYKRSSDKRLKRRS